ncbi:hypothetical protein [Alkalilimnicola sp. S0819]|uniref:hypothetical protein n=1 Tax=Alkalilimnicola sp. S0819 TaxID=2613922 RepID=UPI0012629796|nr:hypothetical protein [Alkalilimnicola sp. S0819]KAB7628174.1 hypothetical protein F3N43_00220 [Alkalilimnicola sp. S0819]MPQ15061.1 hypothetical protein [Alkalilimnicola sp. S0819]
MRRSAAGLLLALALLLAIVHAYYPLLPRWLAGAAGWGAGLLLLPDLASRVRWQAGILLVLGLLGLLAGWRGGVAVPWQQALAGNSLLIAMLTAVSFLRLISEPAADAAERPPRGRRALGSTLLGLHLFGAVINLPAVFIMADRMRNGGRLSSHQVVVLTRAFGACAFWSPFFAAMAAALTYAPEARLSAVMLAGLPLAALALLGTYWQLRRHAESIQGFPMHYGSLWLPGLLALAVLVLHGLWPTFSVLALVSTLAPVLAALVLALRGQATALGRHVRTGVPRMVNELGLFLAAGVLAAGLGALVPLWFDELPVGAFGPPMAAASLLLMWLVALVGVHPVVSIAALGALVAPLEPDPNLLALTFVASWALGVTCGPLSGLNLALHSAYRIPALDLLRGNLAYGLLMMPAVWVVQFTFFG